MALQQERQFLMYAYGRSLMNQIESNLIALLNSISPVVLSAAGICLLVLFAIVVLWMLLLQRKVARLTRQLAGSEAAVAKLASEMEAQSLLARQIALDFDEFGKRFPDGHTQAAVHIPVWASSEIPLNLNRRGQVIRLFRKGKTVGDIAQDLNVSQGEVELLLKVHDLNQKTLNPENENVHS